MSGEDQPNMDAGSSLGSGPRVIDKGFTRNMKIIGIFLLVVLVVVVIMLVSAFSGGAKDQASKQQVTLDTGSSQRHVKNDSEQTPSMQKMLETKQLEDAAKARREGRSYIPPEAIGSLEPVRAPAPTGSTMAQAVSNVNAAPMDMTVQSQAVREGLRNQLSALIPASIVAGAVRQNIDFKGNSTSQPAQVKASDVAGSTAQSPASLLATAATLIPPLEIMTAKLANPITAIKGKPSYASAIITSGDFKGAFLIGTSTMTDTETIETVFTMMRNGNKGYKIDAIVLDEQTADAGVKGDVDRRILARYVLPVAVAVAQGYFTAGANPGTTIVTGATGINGSVTPPSTDDQASRAGYAKGLEILSRTVQKNAEEPITSSVKRDMTIGILFRTAVKEELK